jgi:hypothetical protein
MRKAALTALVLGALFATALGAMQPRRSVEGTVADGSGNPIAGAVVKLKNPAQVRSFVTQEDGRYHFRGLSPEADYELSAERDGYKTEQERVSRFSSRETIVVNFRLERR